MGTKLTSLRADRERIKNGVWFNFAEDVKFLIAHTNNEEYASYLQELIKPHRTELRGKGSMKLITSLQAKAAAKYLLLDWKGVAKEDGTEWKYNVEDGEKVLLDPDYVEIYDFVMERAQQYSAFRISEQEELVGNSKNVSDGS